MEHPLILQKQFVHGWINKFNDRWVGRGGPIYWAPRSPDLSPLDFFLWGYIRTNIYKTRIKDLDDLKNSHNRRDSIEKKKLCTMFLLK